MQGAAADAKGVDDPTVSWGVAGLADWETAFPFLDIARTMRPFFGFDTTAWEAMDHATLAAGSHLDPDGYPLRIPDGLLGIRTVWDWSDKVGQKQREGIYVLTYEGKGSLQLGGEIETIATAPGRIIFKNPTGSIFWLDITATAPDNHIRAISILRADDLALAEAGAVFNPDWLALVQDARELRYMAWMLTNAPAASDWDDRPRFESAQWVSNGVPLEVMVRLANETGTDPWFSMPHNASDSFNREFATYVRDHLDPRLKAHVEYSNEHWNAAFDQFHWLRDQAIAEWGDDIAEDWETIVSYHAKRATQTAVIWEQVFGDQAPDRLVNVLGTHVANPWVSETLLSAPGWRAREPDTFIDPGAVFEELAATTYFGGSFVANADLRTELDKRFRETGDRTYAWLFEQTSLDDALEDSIPAVLRILTEQRAVANSHGLRLSLYEGGQHMHHSFAIEGLSDAQAEEIGTFLGNFVRSPEMAALYSQLWDGWREIGEGPFMQFTEAGPPSRWGSWGILAHLGDSTPRASFIFARQQEGGSWWGEGGGPQYLQGITASGSESPDQMDGTAEEDFFAGLGGDDMFTASPGSDGINGGEGSDTVTFPSPVTDYTITAEGKGHRITSASGSTYVVNVETLRFADGTSQSLN
jgi:hypothetical protein